MADVLKFPTTKSNLFDFGVKVEQLYIDDYVCLVRMTTEVNGKKEIAHFTAEL